MRQKRSQIDEKKKSRRSVSDKNNYNFIVD